MTTHSTKHLEQARFSISLIKWLTVISLVILPFSLTEGIADWRYLIIAPLAGALWISTQVYFWRSGSIIVASLNFLILLGLHNMSQRVYDVGPPFTDFIQWLSLFLFVSAIPFSVCRQRLLRYCGLLKTTE